MAKKRASRKKKTTRVRKPKRDVEAEKRNDAASAQRQARKIRVYRLRLQGMDMRRIAELLNIGLATVHRDLKEAHAENRVILEESANDVREMELARLDRQEADINVMLAKIVAKLETEKQVGRGKDKQTITEVSATMVTAALGCHRTLIMIRKRRAMMLGIDDPGEEMISRDDARRFMMQYNAMTMEIMGDFVLPEQRPALAAAMANAVAAAGNKINCVPRMIESEQIEP